MAGGVGSRFWPLSTPEYPKQFIDILGCGRSLIQLTVDRFRGLCDEDKFWVVTNAAYVETVRAQLPGIPAEHILAEPCARNTAPCIAWACSSIKAEDPSANVVVTPADAIVMDVEGFRRILSCALAHTAVSDDIVTVGIRPTRPETGYGYIKTVPSCGNDILLVDSFREKPDAETAKSYLSDGSYLWNAGIFVWNVNAISSALERFKPELLRQIESMETADDVQRIFPECEKISIDYAVMEPAAAAGIVRTIKADFGWSDLGNWASLYDKLPSDAEANASVGNIRLFECRDCIVHAEDASKVILQGLDGYIVAVKDGNILICRRDAEQRIREFVEK